MIKIAYDTIYAHPLPEGHRFPMLKYELIPEQLLHEGTIENEHLFVPEICALTTVLQTHETEYRAYSALARWWTVHRRIRRRK